MIRGKEESATGGDAASFVSARTGAEAASFVSAIPEKAQPWDAADWGFEKNTHTEELDFGRFLSRGSFVVKW